GSQLAGVDLDDLLRGAGTGVGDQNLHDDASVGHAHERFGVTHRCVPQAVTERVERIALEVQVGAARGDDVVVQRVGQVRNGAVPGLGESSGGFDVAEQHIGQGPTVLLAAVGGPQKGGQVLVRPGHGERVPAAEDED